MPPGSRAIGVGRLAGGGLIAAGLDPLEVAPQDAQAIVAFDVFAERQGQAEQLGMGGPDVVDGLSQDLEELIQPFLGESGPRRPGP